MSRMTRAFFLLAGLSWSSLTPAYAGQGASLCDGKPVVVDIENQTTCEERLEGQFKDDAFPLPLSTKGALIEAPSTCKDSSSAAWAKGLRDGRAGQRYLVSFSYGGSPFRVERKGCQSFASRSAEFDCCEKGFVEGIKDLRKDLESDKYLGSKQPRELRCHLDFKTGQQNAAGFCTWKESRIKEQSRNPGCYSVSDGSHRFLGCYSLGFANGLAACGLADPDVDKTRAFLKATGGSVNGPNLTKYIPEVNSSTPEANQSGGAGSALGDQ
jgi:hypothetical protein